MPTDSNPKPFHEAVLEYIPTAADCRSLNWLGEIIEATYIPPVGLKPIWNAFAARCRALGSDPTHEQFSGLREHLGVEQIVA